MCQFDYASQSLTLLTSNLDIVTLIFDVDNPTQQIIDVKLTLQWLLVHEKQFYQKMKQKNKQKNNKMEEQKIN